MQKNNDDSVTLSKAEWRQINKAYQHLYTIISDSPSSLGDYCANRAQYLNIMRWKDLLAGREFNKANYE
jgi:hypothetical protein